MLARYWDSEERQALAKDKEDAQNGVIHELPPLPPEWAAKYEEIYSSKPPEGVEAVPLKEEEAEPELDVNLDELKQDVHSMMGEEIKPVMDIPSGILNLKRPLSQMMMNEEIMIKDEDDGAGESQEVTSLKVCLQTSLACTGIFVLECKSFSKNTFEMNQFLITEFLSSYYQ